MRSRAAKTKSAGRVVPRQERNDVRQLKRIPVSETNFTKAERKLLPDPDWITEDDADSVVCRRRELSDKGKEIPLEHVLKRYGYFRT